MIWDGRAEMWPWLEFSDRDLLESYCKLKRKEDLDRLRGADIAALFRSRAELCRRRFAGGLTPPPLKKKVDPRGEFMARKLG